MNCRAIFLTNKKASFNIDNTVPSKKIVAARINL